MQAARTLCLLIFASFMLGILLLMPVALALAQTSAQVYEDRQFRFAIIPPPGWTMQNSMSSRKEGVVSFVGVGGTLSVAARPAQSYHRKVIGTIMKYDLSEDQLSDLAQTLYGDLPEVLEPTLAITSLNNQRALLSFYAYEHRSLGAVVYVLLCKAETIRGDIFYKVEVTGPPAETLEEASRLFSASSDLLLQHMRTFVFLPGKP